MSSSSVLLTLLTLITRFFGLNWGSGFFFNPDENNMVHAVMKMSPGDLNPHFFAYGQFPLYLTYFTRNLLGLDHSYELTTYVLRFWSALFSSISVLIFYLIVKKVLNPKIANYATLLFIFTPGIIQLSHFGTTESLMILVFLINIFLSFQLLSTPLDFKTYIYSSLITGIGIASKLSALIFLLPILLVSLHNFIVTKSKLKVTLMVSLNVLLILILFIALSPYSLLENKDFLSALRYETDVATGKMHVFYTNQFLSTRAYTFQVFKIFPYIASWPIYILAIIGVTKIPFRKIDKKLTIVLLSTVVYFLYFGQLYVKWTRFMSPIFFIFPLLAAISISRVSHKLIRNLIILLTIVPGLYFMKLYITPDVRVTATEWMNNNLPINSKVFSEGGNVIDIPLDGGKLDVVNFDFYSLEDSQQSLNTLITRISEADYIVIPSRRVFMNQVGPSFPLSHLYYQALFNGSLGFTPFQTFRIKTDILLNQELAEETWTVFDHPTIRVYKKVNNLSSENYEKIFNP